MKHVHFAKYHGIGNDFILLESANLPKEEIALKQLAIRLCDRNKGIGADGLLIASYPNGFTAKMRIINADGSEPEMCGNGLRCFAKYLLDQGRVSLQDKMVIDTLAGPIKPEIVEDRGALAQVKVDMGSPVLERADIPVAGPGAGPVIKETIEVLGHDFQFTGVSMGNPHAVVFVDDLATLDFEALGPIFESHPKFPNKVNTEFVEVLNAQEARMKVWERGSGPTLACGTGACAILVAGVLNDLLDRQALIHLPGGDLEIAWPDDAGPVWMSGPAEKVFEGAFDI